MNKKYLRILAERFFNESARIETIIFMPGVLASDSFPDTFREFLEETDLEIIEECFGEIPDWVRGEFEDEEYSVASEWLVQEGKFGFLIQMATPVMKPVGESGGRVFSWGVYTMNWVYGDTLEEALGKGFAWVAEQRKKEDCKTEARAGRRR